MIPPRSGRCGNDVVFRPSTKCCTYMPFIPNFLAGAILSDGAPEGAQGRAAFENGARHDAFANPVGVFPTRDYSRAYRWSFPAAGQREDLRCPYYLEDAGGLCGIWRHRNGRCSTWFCKHDRGATGLNFWDALDHLLESVELSLARWCVADLCQGQKDLLAMDPAMPLPGTPDVWGNWAGRESEFYIECRSRVEPLAWNQARLLAGPKASFLEQKVLAAFVALQEDSIPPALVFKVPDVVEPVDAHLVRVWSWSRFDSIDLETAFLNALPAFDGSATAVVVDRIEQELGIRVEESLLRRLIDARILVASGQ